MSLGTVNHESLVKKFRKTLKFLFLRFGSRSGLQLTFTADKKENVGILSESYGIRIALHATGQIGHPEADGYNVGFDETTEIQIK